MAPQGVTTRLLVMAIGLSLLIAAPAAAVPPALDRGDVLAVTHDVQFGDGGMFSTAIIWVFRPDGFFKGTLGTYPGRVFSDIFYRDGIIYVAARNPDAIERIDAATGALLTPFTTDVNAVNYLSPGPAGGVLAVNGSGEIYQFAADGSLVRFRNVLAEPRGEGGIDLSSDGCVVFYGTGNGVVRWDACLNTPASVFAIAPTQSPVGDLRILRDGSFLIEPADDRPAYRLSAGGVLLREYGPFGGDSLALDIDEVSFWTSSGACAVRKELATGATIATSDCQAGAAALAVVGEPRAGLPAPAPGDPESILLLSPELLAAMTILLAFLALLRLRIS